MSNITIPKYILETILEGLQNSMQQCENEKTDYPYKYGYLSTSVQHSIYQLEALVGEQLW
jgi:flagellar motor switch protein FliM